MFELIIRITYCWYRRHQLLTAMILSPVKFISLNKKPLSRRFFASLTINL